MIRRVELPHRRAGAILGRTGWLIVSLTLFAGLAALAKEPKPQPRPAKPTSASKASAPKSAPQRPPAQKPAAQRATNARTAPGLGAKAPGNQPRKANSLPATKGVASRSAPPSPPQARRDQRSKVLADKTATAKRGATPRRSYATQATARRRAREEEARAALRRRAEQARLAELARIRALDESLRRSAQANIEKDDLRGEDPVIRRIALDALGDRAGTVVVMEPASGRVLSIVNQQWAARTPFKPCSTIKVLTGYAALQEKLAAADEEITVGGRTWTLRSAMARSNNEYFQVLGRRLGFERVVAYARQAGFGSRTGINLAGEATGSIPRQAPADMGRTCSHGDGFGVTAIQLATFISAIANGGTLYRPQILRAPGEAASFKPIPVRKLPLSEQLRGELLAGLVSAVERGTARRSGAAAFGVAGKTGSCTCDFGARTRVGLFVSFVDAPDRPGLLVTVITKGSTARGSSASVIAGDVYRGAAVASRAKSRQRIAPGPEEPLAAPDADDDEEEAND